MDKNKQKRRLIGPWRNLHGAVWLIGLAILALRNLWWPGILVLVAISLILEAVLMRYAPQAFETIEPPSPASPVVATPVPSFVAPSTPERGFDLLPSVCAKCGGPIRGQEVVWTSPQSAECPYCGAKLPMGRS
jgi:hypothetical protein